MYSQSFCVTTQKSPALLVEICCSRAIGFILPRTFHQNLISGGRQKAIMTKADEKKIRLIVQDELLGIITDAQESLGMKKDPTGMGRRALEGLADLIRDRQATQTDE